MTTAISFICLPKNATLRGGRLLRLRAHAKTMMALGGLVLSLGMWSGNAHADVTKAPGRPECVAAAKPGGGFDLTCRLAQSAFEQANLFQRPIRVTYMPGGVGATAFSNVTGKRNKDSNLIVAFSQGSLLNLVQGKFGKHSCTDVRWVASVGTDYGVIAVKADSPVKDLKQLAAAMLQNPEDWAIASGTTIGGQDWLQMALFLEGGKIPLDKARFVAYEGGGESAAALLGGHVKILSSGLAESFGYHKSGQIRILAVLSDARVTTSDASQIPTAREQGFDIVWPVVRGFYVPKGISDGQYEWWVKSFDAAMAHKDYPGLLRARGLSPLPITGDAFEKYVQATCKTLEQTVKRFSTHTSSTAAESAKP